MCDVQSQKYLHLICSQHVLQILLVTCKLIKMFPHNHFNCILFSVSGSSVYLVFYALHQFSLLSCAC